MFGFKKRRRKKLEIRNFSENWISVIKKNVPYYCLLSEQQQQELHGLINVFLDEKEYEGCGGLTITDEIRLTISAQACILLLGRKTDFYPTFRTILVYPYAYIAATKEHLDDGTVYEGFEQRLGESWSQGAVVLSWDDVLQGASDIHDGHNLVFHEFAHQLDNESGSVEGAPVLDKGSMYIAWARVLSKEYKLLINNIVHNRKTVMNEYGTTNPAEFFAVATECFFEKPKKLKKKHPDLYEQLKLFYKQDTALLMKKRKKLKNNSNKNM